MFDVVVSGCASLFISDLVFTRRPHAWAPLVTAQTAHVLHLEPLVKVASRPPVDGLAPAGAALVHGLRYLPANRRLTHRIERVRRVQEVERPLGVVAAVEARELVKEVLRVVRVEASARGEHDADLSVSGLLRRGCRGASG